VPHISISDDNYHVTDAIGSYYGDEQQQHSLSPQAQRDPRPLSYMHSPSEVYETKGKRRGGGYFDVDKMKDPTTGVVQRTRSNEKAPLSPPAETGSLSPKSLHRIGSMDAEGRAGGIGPPSSPPALSRHGSAEAAIPLNDIDYESSPAVVAQELSNLQAIRRMSMNVETADPELPFSGGVVPTVAPKGEEDEEDAARLFWVPARVHPELAPTEFKTFIEDRVDKVRRRSGDSDSLSVEGLERSGSGSSSLRRKKSMLSRQIDPKGDYQDGAERLERKRSQRSQKGMQLEGQTAVDLAELETLVNDPQQLMRRMSLDTARRSQDSGVEVPATEDMPILPPGGQTLKRSTHTTYRRGSLKKGERVPYSKRAEQRRYTSESDFMMESPSQSPIAPSGDKPWELDQVLGLTRVQTEPTPLSSSSEETRARDDVSAYPSSHTRTGSGRRAGLGASQSSDNLVDQAAAAAAAQRQSLDRQSLERQSLEGRRSPAVPAPAPAPAPAPPLTVKAEHPQAPPPREEEPQPVRRPQQRQFQSRLASGPGRTTAQLPGYNNTNPLPHIIETLPDGTKVPVGPLAQQGYPERKSSHELPRPMQRGGAHMRPVPGRERASPSSTLDDISSHPSPLPGSGSTRTDALTMVPTFDDRKVDKKDGTRKSSWRWFSGSDDNDAEKEKKAAAKEAKEEKALDGGLSAKPSKASKLSKTGPAGEKARLDVLQSSIDGNTNATPRGRESLVLNRADVQLEDERKKDTKRVPEPKKDKEKESGLLSAIFGGKKGKSSDSDAPDSKKKKRHLSDDRRLSPDPPARVLKPDIDYNWTRFSILEERAIYRMAHIKLANPRRALYSQVLLSNFMYSYLAKVQMMHPQQQIPGQTQQQQRERERERAAQQRREEERQSQPSEYSQYQRYQEVSDDDSSTGG